MQAGAGQPPQKPKQVLGTLLQAVVSSAWAQVPVPRAGSPVLQQLPQTSSHSHVGQSRTPREAARISLRGAEETPIQEQSITGDTEVPPDIPTPVGLLVPRVTNPPAILPFSHGT